MAKATTTPEGRRGKPAAPAGADGRRAKPAPSGGGDGSRRGLSGYLVAVYQELRKVTWPTWRELVRMTQVVIATVILFAFLIGGLDLALSFIAKPLYSQPGTASPSTPAPSINPSQLQGTLPPSQSPAASAPATASPAPSASPSPARTP